MHRSLLLLSKLRFLAQWRKIKRSLRSPKGILLAIVSIGFVAMFVLPRLVSPRIPPEAFGPLTSTLFHPAALFLFWVFTLIGSRVKSPIAFSMAEVAFLFPGPFSRRALLIHKLLVSTLGPLSFAIMAPLAFPFVWWPAAMLGVFLMTTFMQWSAIVGALAGGWIGARFRVLPWIFLAAIVAAALLSCWQAGAFDANLNLRARLAALDTSWAGRTVLIPFTVFSRAITADSAGTMLLWSAGALAMDLGVVAAILKLDRHFLEASLEASRRHFEALQQLKRSGGASSFRGRSRPRFTLPRPPWLFGAGPIAWRQGLETMRTSGGPLLLLIVPVAVGLLAMVLVSAAPRAETPATAVIVGVTLFVGLLLTTSISLGLRSELDHIDFIKSLPIGAPSIVFGSLAAGVGYVTLVQATAAIGTAAALGAWLPGIPLALSLALPINILTVAFDSVLVVLFPSIRHFVPGDLTVGIRMMLLSMAKVLFLGIAAGLAGLPVVAAWAISGEQPWVLVATGCVALLIEGLATAWIAAFLFERFDASQDVVQAD